MKQTAVEWLFDQLEFDESVSMDNIEEIFNQAKEMEKVQVKNAWIDAVTNWDSEKEVEDYIKETFKTK